MTKWIAICTAFTLAVPAGAAGADDPPTASTAPRGDRVEVATPSAATPDESIGEADLAYGAFQRGYYLTALEFAIPRAKLGDPASQTLVAEIYANGLGIPRDMKEAAFWYRVAAEGGDTAAQLKYALLLLEGRHVEADRERARDLMQAAADAGNSSAQFNYGQMLITDQPGNLGVARALPYMRQAAENGIADAQFALAQIYAYGVGLDDADPEEARQWMLQAARSGFDTAQLDLAVWLIDGVGGDTDYEAGFSWMRRAANSGNAMAQNRLSHLYVNAIGTRPDPIEAAKWYILARRAGLEDYALEDFFQGLTADEQKAGIEAANNFLSR